MPGVRPLAAPVTGRVIVITQRSRGNTAVDHIPQDRQNPSAPSLVTDADRASGDGMAMSGGYLVSAEAAAQALQKCFLVNADNGDNAANDELVAKLVRRMRTGHTCSVGASFPRTAEATTLPRRATQ